MADLFFDLDGTLTDPKVGIVRSLQHAMQTLGVEDIPEDLDWCIGPPLHISLSKLVPSGSVDEAVAAYRARYAEKGMFENSVFDGIPSLLQNLKDEGHRLHVATSKVHIFANRILEHFELDGYFETVFGSEMDGTRSNKADLLAHALDVTGALRDRAVMIGDREHDVLGAKANKLRAIGILWGYGSLEELKAAGADSIFETIEELDAYLGNQMG